MKLVDCQNGPGKQGRLRSDCFGEESSLFAILTSIFDSSLVTNILFENRNRKVLEILEPLL